MKSANKNQSGFGIVEYIVVFAVLSLIGIAGYFVYNNHKVKPQSNETTTITQTPTSTQNNSNELIIEEWGVKLTPPSSLGTVTYNALSDAATFSSTLQMALPSSCLWSTSTNGPWGITRISESNATTDEKVNLKHIGSYYYSRVYPQTGCENITDKIQTLDTAYKTAYDSLTSN